MKQADTGSLKIGDLNTKKPFYYFLRDWQLYALVFLPMLFVILFKFVPMFGLIIAFKDYKIARGFWGSSWVGFKVFQDVFSHRLFLPALRNTLLLNLLDLVMGFPMPIILALLLNEISVRWFKRTTQTLLYLPHFLSWVIIGALAYQLFSANTGMVNNLIDMMGGKRFPFLTADTPWLVSYVVIGMWQTMGWGTIIYLASISGINPELYEAAMIDGAGRLRQCFSITIPCIRSTIVILLIMNLGRIMGGSFERIYALANVAATEYTTTIPVLVYRWGIQSMNFSRATALGLFQSVIGLIMVLGSNFISKRLGEEGLI
ncbi:MAG: ABC transporter permease subunit [Treponema sp.]|nr:ABC transporter permease subunit [Treponema sp.]